ncbi:hypothetical protein [Pseudoalteromonas sp. T1lg23B]|uniref:hypothetical protein n=1 Tax=Pseudoalteromonas sp. T1lg23B TaxID=2077097 RepID=UPI001F3BF4BD|nr:hypothetical protein [Pseudoalteromonas sp. T1lg23B]
MMSIQLEKIRGLLANKQVLMLPRFRSSAIPSHEGMVFKCDEQIAIILSIQHSSIFPHALEVRTNIRPYHIIFGDDFEKAKNDVKDLAKEHQVSIFWIDSDTLAPLPGDTINNFSPEEVIAISGFRKWIYCPIIESKFKAYVENLSLEYQDDGSEYELEHFIDPEQVEFRLDKQLSTAEHLYRYYGCSVEHLYPCRPELKDDFFTDRELISALFINLLESKEGTIQLNALVERIFKMVVKSERLAVFMIYHANCFNWELQQFKRESTTVSVYQVLGLSDFLERHMRQLPMKLIALMERKLKLPFIILQSAFSAELFITLRGDDVLFNRKAFIARFCDEEAVRHSEVNNTRFVNKVISDDLPSFNDLESTIKGLTERNRQALSNQPKFVKLCQSCRAILANDSSMCWNCNNTTLLSMLPNSVEQFVPSLMDVVNVLKTKSLSVDLEVN